MVGLGRVRRRTSQPGHRTSRAKLRDGERETGAASAVSCWSETAGKNKWPIVWEAETRKLHTSTGRTGWILPDTRAYWQFVLVQLEEMRSGWAARARATTKHDLEAITNKRGEAPRRGSCEAAGKGTRLPKPTNSGGNLAGTYCSQRPGE